MTTGIMMMLVAVLAVIAVLSIIVNKGVRIRGVDRTPECLTVVMVIALIAMCLVYLLR